MMSPDQKQIFEDFTEEEKMLWAKLHAAHTDIVKLLIQIGTLDFRTDLDDCIYKFSYPLDLATRNHHRGDYIVFTGTLESSERGKH